MSALRRIIRLLTMPCEEVVHLVSESMDRDLSAAERYAVRLHMVYCKACRRFKRQLWMVRRALGHLSEEANDRLAASSLTLSAAARERIRRTLDGDSQQG